MLPQSTDSNHYNWEWVANQSDTNLISEVVKNPDKIISDLSRELFNKKKSTAINRELACKVLFAYKDIKTVNFKEFFSALDRTHVLEDPLHTSPPSLGLIKRTASIFKIISLSEIESFMGLTEDEALGKLYLEAIKSKNEALAYELISCISDLDKARIDKETCLADAKTFPSLWAPLIYRGADVNANKNFGSQNQTAFNYAIESGWEDIALFLIANGLDIHRTDSFHDTPLHSACKANLEHIAEVLIEKGAEISIRNQKGKTPLHLACENGLEKVVLALAKKGANLNARFHDIKDRYINNPTPLLWACEKGQKNIAFILIEQGANIKAVDVNNTTALHWVANKGWEDLISFLIKKGADANALNSYDEIPLHLAINESQENTALALIENGSAINIPDRHGKGPLTTASEHGMEKVVTTLINRGADVKSLDFPSAKALIIKAFKTFGFSNEQLDFLDQAQDFETFESLILSNLPSILKNSQPNPLYFGFVLRSPSIIKGIKENVTDEQFEALIHDLAAKSSFNLLENAIFEVNPIHFEHETLTQRHIPDAPNVDISELETLFNKINFTKSSEKWYRNPDKLTDEGNRVTPEGLKKGLKGLIDRIKNQTPFMGTPREGTQELKDFYNGFEKLLKHITFYIKDMEPDEQATHLIDVAIMGLHCGGKIGEVDSMYKILSQAPPEGLEAPIYTELQQWRLGILMDWSSKLPASYQTHGYNQYMHLVGQELKLPNTEMFSRPDKLAIDAGVRLTKQEALAKFYAEYTPSKLIDFVQQKLWELYQDPKTQGLAINWLTDHTPDTWKQELYQEISDKVAEMEKAKKTRKEIFSMFLDHYDIYLRPDQPPENAIEEHQTNAFLNQKDPEVDTAQEWNREFYDSIKEELKALEKADRKEIEDFFKDKGIPIRHAMDFKDLLVKYRQVDYLGSEALIANEEGKVTGISRSAATHAASVLGIVKA